MAFTQSDCGQLLSTMSASAQALFLAKLGHHLTIVGREAYEVQGAGVTHPRWLRDINEVHHRIYSQIRSLLSDANPSFSPQALASWLSGEGRPDEFQAACLWAFEQCVEEFMR